MTSRPLIGVLAMQGAFREHAAALRAAGADAVEVRTEAQLAAVGALVLPGGESTTIRKGLVAAGLYEPLRERLAAGMPALGTCAGLIVLAHAEADGAPDSYGLFDIEVERNGWGRQPYSFEGAVEFDDVVPGADGRAGTHSCTGVFIRAPRITAVGSGVEVIARLASGKDAGEPVAVRQGTLLGCTFHPELTDDLSLHRLLVGSCKGGLVGRAQ